MRALVIAVGCTLLLCCGGDISSPTTPTTPIAPIAPIAPTITATGSWMGIVGTQALAITMVQNGSTVTGSGTLSNTSTGIRSLTVSGTFLSNSVTASIASGTLQPFTLQGTVTAGLIAGSLSGSGFNGDPVTLNKTGSTVVNAASWIGTYSLVSVNNIAVPASYSILGFPSRVVSRSLSLAGDGSGTWSDSSTSTLLCGPGSPAGLQCNASGAATVAWLATGGSLTVVRSTNSGYVVASKAFVKQSDGSLLKTDDSQTELYRRQ